MPPSLEKGRAIFESPDNVCFVLPPARSRRLGRPEPHRRPVAARLLDRRDRRPASRPGIRCKGMLPFGTGKTAHRRAGAAGGELCRCRSAAAHPAEPETGRSRARRCLPLTRLPGSWERPCRRHSPRNTTRSATSWPASRRDGRRRWIYARQPQGRLYRRERRSALVLLAFLFLAPFVTRRRPAAHAASTSCDRHFVLLGVVFWPQDFHLVVLIALTALVTLMLVDGRRRPDLVRLAVPADDLHGDGLPASRILHRGIGGAAAAP